MAASQASQSAAAYGSAFESGGAGLQSITGALGDIFGGSSEVSVSGSGTRKGTTTISEGLEIEQAGIEKLIQDILGSEQGLASIFSEEQVAGIFSSSVAAQGAGNLLTNLVGEIAKLTAKKVSTKEEDITTTSESTQATASGGLVGQITGLLGF